MEVRESAICGPFKASPELHEGGGVPELTDSLFQKGGKNLDPASCGIIGSPIF